MPFVSVDIGRREYPFDVSARCNRASAKILGSFNYLARKFPYLVHDRFGIIDVPAKSRPVSPLPANTRTGLFEAALARVHELGPAGIAWSGGIDSSFIVACYVHENIPFKVIYNETSIMENSSAGIFLDFFKKNGIEMVYCSTLQNFTEAGRIITGDGADLLFAPGKDDLKVQSPISKMTKGRMSICDALLYIYKVEGEKLWSDILEYAKKLNRPVRNDTQIARLIQWGCFYYFKRDYFRVVTGADPALVVPFFDTDIFMNISYSSFWEARYEDGKKWLQRKVISQVLDRRLFNLMSRNPSPYLRPGNAPDYYEY